MSREFGSYTNGYFHEQIDTAAVDCLGGKDELTRKFGEFLREFQPIAYAISTSEACDSGPEYPIFETMQRLPTLVKKLHQIKDFLEPYQRVAEKAVQDYQCKK